MLLMMLTVSYAQEPLWLGRGAPESVVNLDVGARSPGYVPSFGTRGFAAPVSHQVMALSPGAMIHQAESLLSEAKRARDEAISIHNLTRLMAVYASENASIARSMAESAETSAKAAKTSAYECRVALNETKSVRSDIISIYNLTRLMAVYASENASIARSMAESAEMSAEAAKTSAYGSRIEGASSPA
ncbi:MAG: hypothetical protein N3G75_04275 [Methanothrix sp.]|nr:hypothetical protein [Methanothrix sp.]MCX8207032.1 hypothetical protein [Methanothrix sp.]